MNIKINTNISEEFSDITININAPKITEEIENLISQILRFAVQNLVKY